MVKLLHLTRDCFFLLRRHRNDANKLFFYRHYEPASHWIGQAAAGREEQLAPNLFRGRSNLYRSAIICLIAFSILILNTTLSFSQTSKESIKIGFLIRDKNDLATKQAAELAIEHANAHGGYKGKSFQLITKSCDGPWGIGSKQAVSLVYDDEVSMIVGAMDGRNAHLAEQVAAKSHVVMLSTLSSDPTLSRAYVPWYFRLVPDDRQQAEVLLEEIYNKKKIKKIALVSLDNYDGKMSVESMVKEAKDQGLPEPKVFIGLDGNELVDKITINLWDAIVLAGTSKNAAKTIEKIRAANANAKIYAFLNLFNFMDDYQAQFMKNIWFVSPFNMNDPKWKSFEKRYQSKYGKNPSPSLAFVYDGILLSIEAIRKFSPDPEAVRNGFKSLSRQQAGMEFEGITGGIRFDNLGNRKHSWRLVN